MAEMTARAKIRDVVRLRIQGADEISLPTITDSVVALLMQDDDFVAEFMRTTLRSEVYQQVAAVVAATRDLSIVGDTAMSEGAVKRKANEFASRFLGWYEHAGDRHVQVMEMTREDLIVAAAERRQRGDREFRLANLWTRLADSLEGGQKVSERFTAEQVEALYQNIENAMQEAS